MSKTKQRTLIQTWGSSALSQPISQKKNLPEKQTRPSKQPLKSHLIKSAAELVDLCSSSEDEDLTLAKKESLRCSTLQKVDAPEVNDDCRANFSLVWDDDDDDLDLLLFNQEHSSEAGAKSNALKHSLDDGRSNENSKVGQWNLANRHNLQRPAGVSTVSKPAEPFSCNGMVALAHGSDDAEDIAGFDRDAGRIWIYPTNYPVRDYQFNIILQALFRNTLVTLPTGLGKTFVAAVVMYNFFRWYPAGKVVFMAPTKPLVAQQIEACHNIMGIPMADTVEMTGSLQPAERQREWSLRRVFFLTPQVLVNDLISAICPAAGIKCVIVDEAHKALGNHAYCQVVRELTKREVRYRMVALSATPGSDIKSVQQVLNNLLISHIELRTEDSIDIQGYRHERKIEKVVIPLGDELNNIKEKYLKVIEVMVQRLRNYGVMYSRDIKSLSKFLVLKARDDFRQNPPPRLPRHLFGIVEGDFAICMSLYHGYELLLLHGLRTLCSFLEGLVSGDKAVARTRSELLKNQDFTDLLEILKQTYKPIKNACPNATQLTQKSSQLQSLAVGHPKLAKLEEIVLEHFQKFNDGDLGETRVMIFSQYRDSVNEITEILNRHRPLVKVMSFVGQSTGKTTKGFSQKDQLKVMRQFRDGGYNTLVSTCVGEEGLDIGDVDLIVCFDAHKSPIRLVQRMGRTGRKREGRIVMLVSEGKEEKTYNQGLYNKKAIHRAILNGTKSLVYYQNNPRMIPRDVNPACHRMPMTIPDYVGQQKSKRTDGNQAKRLGKKSSTGDGFLTDSELRYWSENFKIKDDEFSCNFLSTSEFLCLRKDWAAAVCETDNNGASCGNLLSKWLPWQNRLQETHLVEHSLETCHLVELLEFTDIQASCQDDIYGLEMKAFLQMDDVIDSNEIRGSKTKDKGILRFCRTRCSLDDVNDVNSATNSHLEAKVDESTKGRCKKKRRADVNALVETHVEPLIRVIEERDQADFEKNSDALCDSETEWSESNKDIVDHKHSEIGSRDTLDAGKPKDFPSLSQIVPTKAVESWFSDVGTHSAEANGLLVVAPAPSMEEAIASMTQIGRMLRVPSVDVTELFNEWKLDKASVVSNAAAAAAVQREKRSDLTELSTSRVVLSSKLQKVSNQAATFAPTTDIDPIVSGVVALGRSFHDGKSNQEMFQQLMPCWNLSLSDDSLDFNEEEDDNVLIEAVQLEATKTIDRSDSERNRSQVKGRHVSMQDDVSESEANGLNCASKNICFGFEAMTVAPSKVNLIPSDLNNSTFEKPPALPCSKCVTPATVTSQLKTTVGGTTVASMQSHFESRAIAQASKQNLSMVRNGSFVGFEDNIDDSILAGINLPSPNHPPPGNANTSQLTFTQALARLQTSYNSSIENRTVDKSIDHSLNREPRCLQPRDDPMPKFAVSEIPVPHFDLGLDLDEDDDDDDDDVIPPSPPSANPSMLLKLRSLSKVNVGSGEQKTPSNQIQVRNLINSRAFSNSRLLGGERGSGSQTVARDLSFFVSKSCVRTALHSDETSSAKCHETDVLNECNDSALSAQVKVIDETQPFETSELTLQRLFCNTPVESKVKCPRLRHQCNSTPKQKQPMMTGDENVFTPSSDHQMLQSLPQHLTSTPGFKPARTELKNSDHNNETSGDDSFCLVKNKIRNRPAVILSQPSPAVNNNIEIYSIEDTHTPVKLSRRARKKRPADRVSSEDESPIQREAKRPKVTMSSLSFGGGGNDDDDFQDEKIIIRNKLKHPTIGNSRIRNGSNKNSKKRRKALKNKARAFIEEEASVSDVNCSELSSDDEDGSDLDQMDDSFINDDTLLSQSVVNDSIDTHAMYIHSVRSPNIGGLGKYKLKDVRSFRPRADVLSQLHEEDEIEDEYEEDSFCVGENAEDLINSEYTENSHGEENAETSVESSSFSPKQCIKPKRRRILEISEEEEDGIDVENVALSLKARKNLLSKGSDRLKARKCEKSALPCQAGQNVDNSERRINRNQPCGISTRLLSSSIARSFPSNTTESTGSKELRQITEDRLNDRSKPVVPTGPNNSMGKNVGKDIPTFSLDINDLLGDSGDELGDFIETAQPKHPPPKKWTVLKDRTSYNLCNSISNAGCSRDTPSTSIPSAPGCMAAVASAEKLREDRIRLSLQKKEEFQKKFNKR